MKVNRFENAGDFRGFEIPNTLAGKEGVKELLLELPGHEIRYLEKSWPQELFCEFSHQGLNFQISEPYGDNSYYDIMYEKPNTEALEEIYGLFASTSVPTRKRWIRMIKLLAVLVTIILTVKYILYKCWWFAK